ncbi:hypothetical protein [Natranaerofaba carboxydovora]|uniref:hypothetical protein n=1 Tax=Natranaerofaba carboxydovora TaxID=2742683 RepID=UPI001F1467BE|nr:hypothetical protein [Natranaerofaba carboxydovora]UMZ73689.1 hypothetical protein ACONDI_01254 [Natranaerofaba carboxydovora]
MKALIYLVLFTFLFLTPGSFVYANIQEGEKRTYQITGFRVEEVDSSASMQAPEPLGGMWNVDYTNPGACEIVLESSRVYLSGPPLNNERDGRAALATTSSLELVRPPYLFYSDGMLEGRFISFARDSYPIHFREVDAKYSDNSIKGTIRVYKGDIEYTTYPDYEHVTKLTHSVSFEGQVDSSSGTEAVGAEGTSDDSSFAPDSPEDFRSWHEGFMGGGEPSNQGQGEGSIWGGIGKVPFPENGVQAAAGILIPGLMAIGLDYIGRKGGNVTASALGEKVISNSRTYEEIVEAPNINDRVIAADGEEYIYTTSPTDASDKPFWISAKDYEIERSHIEQGHIYQDGAWFRPEDARRRQSNLEEQRQKELDRAETSPNSDQHLKDAFQEIKEQEEMLDRLQQMERTAFNRGMLSGKDDTHGRICQLIDDLVNEGKAPDPEQVKRIRDHIGGRISGATLGPNDVPAPENPWWTDVDSMVDSLGETGRNITTATNSNGTTSWPGLVGRIGIGALTGGSSEWVFTPIGSNYTIKDAIDRGESGLSATYQGIKQTLVQDLFGRAIGGAVRATGGALSGAYGSLGEGAGGAVRGGLRGGWGSLKESGADLLGQASDLFSRRAWEATGRRLTQSVSQGASRIGNILSGREGYTGPRSLSELAENITGSSSKVKLTPTEQSKLQQFDDAVRSGDPDRVSKLYRNGGMRDLDALQRKGAISREAAQECNRILGNQVNESVRQGTRGAIIDTQNSTHVRVQEVIVADSGSSARGAAPRLRTDADRTVIPRFNKSDLNKYAHRNNISPEEAYEELSRRFTEYHARNVDQSLQSRGLSAQNVDYKSYDRIGKGAGQADSYAEGFTNARQATSGTAEVYRVNADGSVQSPYRTSGQAAVDANQLNNAQYGTGRITDNPTAFTPEEVKSVLNQQIRSVTTNPNDPLVVAKALGRAEKGANVLQQSLNNPDLIRAANEINQNPGRLNEVIETYGLSSIEAFNEIGRNAITEYSRNL